MAREKFTIADLHFTQPSMCSFAGLDGVSPLRPWGRVCNLKGISEEERADLLPEFEAYAAEMDEALVDNWNKTVPATGATVYVLGDVVMKAKHLPILSRLNGKLKLILGNHDILGYKAYAPYFYEIEAYRIGDGIVMSHIPIHEASLKKTWKANVHGHLHGERVMKPNPEYTYWSHQWGSGSMDGDTAPVKEILDPRYLCVSVEHTNYAPLSFDEMFARIDAQQEAVAA